MGSPHYRAHVCRRRRSRGSGERRRVGIVLREHRLSITAKVSLSVLVLVVIACTGTMTGPAGPEWWRVPLALLERIPGFGESGLGISSGVTEREWSIIWDIRMPRVVLAGIVGATLSLGGASYQGVFRNPLSTPTCWERQRGRVRNNFLRPSGGRLDWLVDPVPCGICVLSTVLTYLVGPRLAGCVPQDVGPRWCCDVVTTVIRRSSCNATDGASGDNWIPAGSQPRPGAMSYSCFHMLRCRRPCCYFIVAISMCCGWVMRSSCAWYPGCKGSLNCCRRNTRNRCRWRVASSVLSGLWCSYGATDGRFDVSSCDSACRHRRRSISHLGGHPWPNTFFTRRGADRRCHRIHWSTVLHHLAAYEAGQSVSSVEFRHPAVKYGRRAVIHDSRWLLPQEVGSVSSDQMVLAKARCFVRRGAREVLR